MKHENVVLFDNAGLPSIMVKFIPETGKPLDPMFKVCGRMAKAIYISKYENTLINDLPYSLPIKKAKNYISFEEASNYCRSKGPGWHLMTNAEWMYLQNESIKNGTIPHGNTARGSYYFDMTEKGRKYDYGHTLTGSGPVTWAHTHTPDGVYDLCGNNWEMVAGLRLRYSAIEYIKDNDAATEDLSPDSKAWQRARTAAGETIYLDAGYKNIIVTTNAPENDNADAWNSSYLTKIEIALDEVPDILRELGIVPQYAEGKIGEKTAYINVDNGTSESIALRGGCYIRADAGQLGLHLGSSCSRGDADIGFRSAYVEF